MTIDETLEVAEKIDKLIEVLEMKFFNGQTAKEAWDLNNPVRRDCLHNLYSASKGLRDYALGFKELQFAQ